MTLLWFGTDLGFHEDSLFCNVNPVIDLPFAHVASFFPNPKINSFVEQNFTEHLFCARPQHKA